MLFTLIAACARPGSDAAGRADDSPPNPIAVPEHALLPRLAPNGARLAYLERVASKSNEGSDYEGFALFVEGSGARRQLGEADQRLWFATAPAWSPDGSRLATIRNEKTSLGTTEHWLGIAVGDGPLEKLADLESGLWRSSPAWSPDGERLALAWIQSSRLCLTILSANGKRLAEQRVAAPDHGWAACSWSSDGARIALVGAHRLYVAEWRGTPASGELALAEPRLVATLAETNSEAATAPIWIDGNRSVALVTGTTAWSVELASGLATRLSAELPVVDLARDPATGGLLGLVEREVRPGGLSAAGKALETLATAGHPRETYERALLRLDPDAGNAREVPGSRSVSSIDPMVRDLALPPEVRARLARR